MKETKINKTDVIFKYLFGLCSIFCLVAGLLYFILKFKDSNHNIHGYESTDPSKVIESRQAVRGELASLITILLFTTVNFILNKVAKVDASTSTALLGLFFGGTLGFLLDNFIGVDEGWKRIKNGNVGSAWDYAMSNLFSQKFCRFLLTVMFDTMLTVIIFKYVIELIIKLPFFRVYDLSYSNLVASMIIGIITFGSYANIMRFTWAYPNLDVQDTSGWLSGKIMSILLSVVSVLFLSVDTKPNLNRDENITFPIADELLSRNTSVESSKNFSMDINQSSSKVVIVIGTLVVLTILSKFQVMEPESTYNNTLFIRIDSDRIIENDSTITIVDDLTNTEKSMLTFEKDKVDRLLTDLSRAYPYELESGNYKVILSYSENIYKVHKINENTINTKSNENLRVWIGKLIFFLIGFFTSTITILGTSKAKTTTKVLSLLGFFIYLLLLIFIPSLL